MAIIRGLLDKHPRIADSAFIAENATLIGDVEIGPQASVWYGCVLRADVGITEQAWEVREEELERVHNLQTERAREEQLLDEELREVLDDTGEGPGAGSKK